VGIFLVKKLRPKPNKLVVISIVPALILILDQWTKFLVLEKFRLGESISIIEGFFNLTYIRNPGAAFGIFAQSHPSFRGPFFLLIPLVAMIVIGMVFKKLPKQSLLLSTALSLVMGGAVGNLIDRVRFGYVVDFLDFHWRYGYHFPAFNVADSAICVGVGILILDILIHPEKENAPAST
jgi:signal peptidase II